MVAENTGRRENIMKADRILDMERYICQHGSASMEDLRRQFDVSMNTVRRDVAMLLRRGTVEKFYGGVRARTLDQHVLTPYEVRRGTGEKAKIAVGQAATELVRDGDVIFIDSGTTTMHMVDFLASRQNVTIVTHNLEVIFRVLPNENITVIALPGQVQRKTNSITGGEAVRFLKQFNIRKAFMAATGISPHGASNSFPLEYEIKRMAVEHCEQAILLVTHEKFGVSGLMTYAPLSAFSAVVTDQAPDRESCERVEQAGAKLLVARP